MPGQTGAFSPHTILGAPCLILHSLLCFLPLLPFSNLFSPACHHYLFPPFQAFSLLLWTYYWTVKAPMVPPTSYSGTAVLSLSYSVSTYYRPCIALPWWFTSQGSSLLLPTCITACRAKAILHCLHGMCLLHLSPLPRRTGGTLPHY